MVRSRMPLLTMVLTMLPWVACQCDDLGSLYPNGAIVPSVLDLGPITIGQKCSATLGLKNTGNVDLHVSGGALKNTNGDFVLRSSPPLVKLGSTESILLEYTAGGVVGALQSTTVEINSDDRKNKGVLRATVSAVVSDGVASVAKVRCNDAQQCTDLAFGAVQLNGTGAVLTVTLVNDGTAPLTVAGAFIDDGNPAFVVESLRRGTTLVQAPVTVPPGRSEDCGKAVDGDNTLLVDVRFVPTQLGATASTLSIASDALVGNTLEVPLSGVGSDVGIITNPEVVTFGAVPEGEVRNVDVLVQNVGTSDVGINECCVDLQNDGDCDAVCSGDSGDKALSDTLGCKVTNDGAVESHGYLLSATDAVAGGSDERTVTITWAPTAGASSIPNTAVLALHSNILGERVYTVPVRGGAQGVLTVSGGDACPAGIEAICIQASGDAADTQSWAGSTTFALNNTGVVTLTIASVNFENGSAPTIVDDFTLDAAATFPLTIAPGLSASYTLSYANNDASQIDLINLVAVHDGEGGETIIPTAIVPPG